MLENVLLIDLKCNSSKISNDESISTIVLDFAFGSGIRMFFNFNRIESCDSIN